MCGIAGAVGNLSRAVGDNPMRHGAILEGVRKTSDALSHRGPNGSGTWSGAVAEVVLAHRRLSVLDLSEAGSQPMVDAASGCVITFNGEIYNFRELRQELVALGERFRSTSDTEVVLRAYACWGLAAVPRLRGIFAFAVWDPRTKAVHLVRDHLGIKPLYWTIARDGVTGSSVLLFSSEVRALLASGLVERRLNPAGVASYLSHGFVVGPETIVAGVNLLPAACTLTLTAADPRDMDPVQGIRRYWDPPASSTRTTSVEHLRHELANTVRLQLVADVPLGIFLSGGIDSSAVAAMASEVEPDAVHTFTIGFEESSLDESVHAARVAAAIGSRHNNVTLRQADFLRQLPDALSSIDQPTFDAINTYFVSRAAREAGMTVALAGTGGDELFGGYTSFVDLPKVMRSRSWMPGGLLNGLVGVAARAVGSACWNVLGTAPRQTRWGKLADVARAANLVEAYQVSYELFTRDTQARLATAAVRKAQQEQPFGLPREVAALWQRRIEGSGQLHAISLLEMSSFLGERLLRDTDAASMAVALEVRVPLLDHVLWETVAGIDPARRFQPLGRKQLLRDVGLSKLDPAMFDRPKSGFVLPIDSWSRRALQPMIEVVFADEGLVRSAGLDPKTVDTFWRSYLAGKPGLHWSRAWSLFVLLAWCRDHRMAIAP